MTKPLAPRVPAASTGEPSRPPVMITPRVALAAGACVALLAASFALAFKPAKAQLPPTLQVAAAHYSVQMANFAFAPAAITVHEGDTITWTNQDTAPHTVTTTSGPERLDSPYLSKGQSWSYTFTAPGMYMYYCTVHPDMRAEVIVQAPAPATTAAAPAPTHAQQQQQHQTQNPPASYAPRGNTGAVSGNNSKPHAATASSAPPASSAQASAAAGAGPAAPSSGPPAAAQPQSQQAADSSSIRTLSPVLLLGGLTTAVAVFCLLLVGSRATGAQPNPAPAQATPSGDPNDDDH
jgi:plastocyanin